MASPTSTSSAVSRVKLFADARFLIGIALVLASVAAVWFIVSSGRTSAPVLQATRTIVVGEPVRSGDFRVVDASLGAAQELYITPSSLSGEQIAARTITSGELVPVAAVADAASARQTTVVVPLEANLSRAVTTGSTIDLWRAQPQPESRTLAPPTLLVAGVSVNTREDQRGVVGKAATQLELTIPREDVPAVLAALTDGSVLSAVPAAGSSTHGDAGIADDTAEASEANEASE